MLKPIAAAACAEHLMMGQDAGTTLSVELQTDSTFDTMWGRIPEDNQLKGR